MGAVLTDLPKLDCPLRPEEIAVVARVPLFSGLPPESLPAILAEARVVRHPRGRALFHQGDEARALHVLLEGQVGLTGSVKGGETVVEILDAGEAFIIAAVLTGKPFLMGATALTQCRVLELPREPLLDAIMGSPCLALSMLTSLARHFRMLVREVKALKLQTASQRLAAYLLGLTPKRRGSAILKLPHNKGVIARRVGVRAETLSRVFATLRDQGVVVDGNTVAIVDVARLSRFCHEGEDAV